MKSIEDIAYEWGYDLIETTSERNGYPSNLKKAIIGFGEYEEAEKVASENNLSVEFFDKKDGWQLYYRTGHIAYKEMEISPDTYGDDFALFDTNSIESFYEDEIKSQLGEFDNLESLQSFINKKQEVLERLQMIDDDEVIITHCGCYYDTVQKKTMCFNYDTKTTVIGLIER